MLQQLLFEIRNGGTTSIPILAARLNTTPEMVDAMLETLESQGYLKSVEPACDKEKGCESCSLAGMCSSAQKNPRIRILTK